MASIYENPGFYPERSWRDPKDDEIDHLRQKVFQLNDEIMMLKAKVISYERYLNIPSAPVDKKFGDL